jgi:hypothetical protein
MSEAEERLLAALAWMASQYLETPDGSFDHMAMSAGEAAVARLGFPRFALSVPGAVMLDEIVADVPLRLASRARSGHAARPCNRIFACS